MHWDPKTGFWGKHGVIMEEDVVAMEVDIPNTLEAKQTLLQYAENKLLNRFRQEAIYVRFVPFAEIHLVQ